MPHSGKRIDYLSGAQVFKIFIGLYSRGFWPSYISITEATGFTFKTYGGEFSCHMLIILVITLIIGWQLWTTPSMTLFCSQFWLKISWQIMPVTYLRNAGRKCIPCSLIVQCLIWLLLSEVQYSQMDWRGWIWGRVGKQQWLACRQVQPYSPGELSAQ